MRTPVSYYGGKQAIIKHLLELVPPHEVYTEVFFGGGTLFFAKDPAKNETINDKLDSVINFYQVVKNDFDNLNKLIQSTLYSRTTHRKAKKMLWKNSKASNLEKAWAFWVAANLSYSNKLDGGLKHTNSSCVCPPDVLTNKKNRFNTNIVSRLEHACIENGDALEILNSRNVKKAFHYLDPPYPGADQGHYKGYSWGMLNELLKWCANECKGKFLLSNYNSGLLDTYVNANKWNKKEITHRLQAPRKSGSVKTEVLVWNYDLTGHGQQLSNELHIL